MKKMLAITILLTLFLFAFASPQTVIAQEPVAPGNPGVIAGIGTHFEATDSQYLTFTLDSTALIDLVLEPTAEMVFMHVADGDGAPSTAITLRGLPVQKEYHLYTDGMENHQVFVTDANGAFTFSLDLSAMRTVFVLPIPSTKFIYNSPTGGDCTTIGTWDAATKTCTLNRNVTETIQLGKDANLAPVTLNGNGFAVSARGVGLGVVIPNGMVGAAVKNLKLNNLTRGIYMDVGSSGSTITGNTFISVSTGIYLYSSNGNTITDNNFTLNFPYSVHHGIQLFNSCSNNLISRNTFTENTLTPTSGIYIYNLSTTPSTNNTVSHNVISMANTGIYISGAVNNTFTDNTLSKNGIGMYLWPPSPSSPNLDNKIYHNNFLDNTIQISDQSTTANTFNQPKPVGGNYWSNHTGPDANSDGFVDTGYMIRAGVYDNLPFTRQNGWIPPADALPPTTTDNATTGWQKADFTVTLTCTDGGPSGCKETKYRLGGSAWQTGTSVAIASEGDHLLEYYSVDNAGNQETTKSV